MIGSSPNFLWFKISKVRQNNESRYLRVWSIFHQLTPKKFDPEIFEELKNQLEDRKILCSVCQKIISWKMISLTLFIPPQSTEQLWEQEFNVRGKRLLDICKSVDLKLLAEELTVILSRKKRNECHRLVRKFEPKIFFLVFQILSTSSHAYYRTMLIVVQWLVCSVTPSTIDIVSVQ